MWVITIHSKKSIKMFEFDTQKEAKEAFERIKGCKILTEVIYFNDFIAESTNPKENISSGWNELEVR